MMLKNRSFLIGFLFTLVLFLALTFSPYFIKTSYNQTMRVYQIDKCLRDGQIPCRWVPDLGQMYGYPLFNYYAPLPYYLGEAGYLLTHSFLLAVRVTFSLFGLVAYLFVYLMAPKFWTFYSLVSSAVVIYGGTGSLGEIAVLALIPALVWALRRLICIPAEGSVLILSLVAAISVLSHHIIAMLFLPASVVFLLSTLLSRRDFKQSLKFSLHSNFKLFKLSLASLVLSLLLASFYIVPLILERDYVRSGESGLGYIYRIERSGADFLPSSVEESSVKPTIPRYQVLTGESQIADYQSGTNWISFKTETKTHSIIRLSQFYFPNWRVLVDGKEAEISYKDNSLGLITFILGPGKHNVEARLFDTPVRDLANLATGLGFFLYLAGVIVQIQPLRRWLSYYLNGLFR